MNIRSRLNSFTSVAVLILFIFSLLLSWVNYAQAKPKANKGKPKIEGSVVISPSEQIHKRLMSLRNTDPQVQRASDWESLGSDADKIVDTPVSAEFLSDVALIHREYGRGISNKDQLKEAANLYERIPKLFPKSPIADDGLVHAAEIYEKDLDDKERAKELYDQVLKEFPSSDMAVFLRAKTQANSKDFSDSSSSKEQSSDQSQRPVVVIDPGHGGEDFGAQSDFGLLEKDIVLAIGFEVEKELSDRLPVKVVLTRKSDTFVPLLDRVAIANDNKAVAFVSIHVNASAGPKGSGIQTYVLDNSDNEASRLLAERENKTATEGVSDLDFILSDLTQSAKQPESTELATTLQKFTVGAARKQWKEAKDMGVKHGPFYVLVGAHMPCVLSELFFIDNPADNSHLVDPDFRKILAKGISDGIATFLKAKGLV